MVSARVLESTTWNYWIIYPLVAWVLLTAAAVRGLGHGWNLGVLRARLFGRLAFWLSRDG